MSAPDAVAIHPTVAEILHSGPTDLTDNSTDRRLERPTGIAFLRAILPAWLKINAQQQLTSILLNERLIQHRKTQ